MNITTTQGQQEVKKPLPQLIKQSSTYKLIVPKKVEEKIRYLIRKFPHTEWSGILFYSHTGSFEGGDLKIQCEDIYPMDLGSGTFTDFKMDESVVSYIADNIDLFGCEMGLVHSHHTMGAFFSGTDINTLRSEGNDTNCFVSLIVDTKGTYQAAITRKVKEKKELTTYYFGKSYEFFGEGEVKTEPPYQAPEVHQKMVDEERIEYFMLDVQREETNNPLDYLDIRFDKIEAKKKRPVYNEQYAQRLPAPKWDEEGALVKSPGSDYDFDTEHQNMSFREWLNKPKDIEQPSLFGKEAMDELVDINKWQPDPTVIHYLVCQLVTSSLIVNKDIDLKQWITKHMAKKYNEIFDSPESDEFNTWSDGYVEFILNRYYSDDIPSELMDDWDTLQSKVAEAIIDELNEYPSNAYIKGYSDILERYILIEVPS